MNKLQQLIQQLCPNGVEYIPLGEICISLPKGTLKREVLKENEKYYVVNSGREWYGKYAHYNNEGNAFTVAARGEYAGFVKYIPIKFWAGGLCYPYRSKDEKKMLTKFIYYILKEREQEIRNNFVTRGSIPAINKADVDNIIIPFPPLKVQEEIVCILDKFSLLSAELEAELELRKKQYDFYRNRLLSFDSYSVSNTDESSSTGITYHKGYYPLLVKWKKLGEIFEMRNGYTPSKNNPSFWENGTIPWFRMEDIRENGRILSDSIQHITSMAVKGKGLFEAGSFILATTATIGEHALLIADSLANQRFTNLKIRKSLQNSLLTKFVFYYMFVVDDYCKTHTHKSGFESVDMDALRKMPFPIPSIEEQERIVKILDRFESLVNDLSQGLPAEIAAVQQQYEYYRNKLLTFPRKDIA